MLVFVVFLFDSGHWFMGFRSFYRLILMLIYIGQEVIHDWLREFEIVVDFYVKS